MEIQIQPIDNRGGANRIKIVKKEREIKYLIAKNYLQKHLSLPWYITIRDKQLYSEAGSLNNGWIDIEG